MMKIPMLPMDCWGNVSTFMPPSEFGKLLQVNKTFHKDLWNYTPEHIAKRIAHFVPKNLFKIQCTYFDHFQVMLNATTTDYTFCLHVGESLKNDPLFKKIIKNSLAAAIIDSHAKEAEAENEETQTDEDKQFDKLIIDTLGTNKKNTLISQLCQLLSPEKDGEVTFVIDNLLKIRAVARHALKNSTFFLQVSQGDPSQFNVKKSILQLHPGDAELEL